MKRKIIFLSLIFALSASMVLAQGTGNKNSGVENSETGSTQEQDNKDNKENGQESVVQKNQPESSQGENANESVQTQTQVQNQEQEQEQAGESNEEEEQVQQQNRARNMEELKTMIANKKQEMDQGVQKIKDAKQRSVYQNQNRISKAVHALLAAEDLAGGIGQQVSAIAREFNNSVKKTIQAEEKIQKRNKFVEFFFGGDNEIAENILQEVNKNKEKLQNLKNLRQQCDCAEEVKNVIQEQVQNIEQEQNRLEQLAQEQKSKKGIFGWLFGWMQ